MVNTELHSVFWKKTVDYNILNIVVNTELLMNLYLIRQDYNILNIVVNTEPAA